MRLHYLVAAVCLIQAITMCFVLSPITAVVYSPSSEAQALWLILDPNTVRQSLRCFDAASPLTCLVKISEVFHLHRALSIRMGVCLIAVATGLLMFNRTLVKISQGR